MWPHVEPALLAATVWVINFGPFVVFYRAITDDIASEDWKSRQLSYVLGTVPIGYGLAAVLVSAAFVWLSDRLRRG